MGDAVAPEIAATDYHTAGEPFRIVTAGVPEIPGATVRERREHAAASDEIDARTAAALPRAARARRHVRLLPRPARRRRRRPRRALLAQGRLLDRVRARDDRARRRGRWSRGRVAAPDDGEVDGHDRRAVGPRRRARADARRARSRAVAFRNVPSFVDRARRRGGRRRRSTSPTAARSTPRVPAARFGLRVVPDDLPRADRRRPRGQGGARRAPTSARHPDRRAPVGHLRDDPLRRRSAPLHQRNVTVFADGEVDRSPCGSGDLGARRAARRRRRLGAGRRPAPRLDRRHDVPRPRRRPTRPRRRAHRGRGHGVPHRRAPLRARPARPARHRLRPAMSLPFLAAADVAQRLTPAAAVDALEAALRAGLDPEADPPRSALALGGRRAARDAVGRGRRTPVVKLVTVGGEPRIQGVCVVFDATTLAPVALVDGIALTNVRTPAVSALAVRRLAVADARRLLVFGRGPQAHGHVEAIRAVRPIEHVDMVGRDARRRGRAGRRRRRRLLRHDRARAAVRRRARGRPRDGRRHRLARARGARDRRRARRAARRSWSSRARRRCARRAT